MNKKIVGIFICLLLICTVLPVSSNNILIDKTYNSTMTGKILYVGGSGLNNYTKIQDAIDNASSGDTVFVYSGTYYENIVIQKSISIKGENVYYTVIDYKTAESNIASVVSIECSNVNLMGFTIIANERWISGIEISGNNCCIEENLLYRNTTSWNNVDGIIIHGNNNIICKNEFKNHYWCILIMDSQKNSVISNNFYNSSSLPVYQAFHINKLSYIFNFLIGNEFNNNFYNKSISYPYPILIYIILRDGTPYSFPTVIPLFVFEWHPAKEPNDIG